jgi:hypothetical protein
VLSNTLQQFRDAHQHRHDQQAQPELAAGHLSNLHIAPLLNFASMQSSQMPTMKLPQSCRDPYPACMS